MKDPKIKINCFQSYTSNSIYPKLWNFTIKSLKVTCNLFDSLHNSLSDEKNLREQFNATIQSYEDKLRQFELSNRQLDQDNQELNSKLNNVVRERDEKARQLHEATTAKYLAEQKADKLVSSKIFQ